MKLFPIAGYRKWLLGFIVLTAITWGGVYAILQKINCINADIACGQRLSMLAAFTWDFFPKAIILSTLLIMCFPERVFRWWRWFALVAMPYAVWDILNTKMNIDGFFGGTSPRITGDHDGVFFLSFSVVVATMSVLIGKISEHTFSNIYYRIGSYAIGILFSMLIGIIILVSLFSHYF